MSTDTPTLEIEPDVAAGTGKAAADTIFGIALGYLVSRSLHVATELRIADLLADGPLTVEQLAAAARVDPSSLHRLLRTLAAHGVFTLAADGRVSLSPAAELLRDGVFRDGVLLCGEVMGDGSWWNAVGGLRSAVATGEPAFSLVHGASPFAYIADDPERRRWFDRGMANFSAAENPAIAASYGFDGIGTVVDVGGGQGGFLAEILRRSSAHGVLFDAPDVIGDPAAPAAPDLAGRWSAVAGDFFAAVPAGADLYVLKRILHDWSDDECVQILTACRAAMPDRARLLVVDAAIPAGNGFHPAKVMDILMMVFSGRERTEDEFAALLARAGLALTRVIPTPSTLSIIEAARA